MLLGTVRIGLAVNVGFDTGRRAEDARRALLRNHVYAVTRGYDPGTGTRGKQQCAADQ